MLLPQHAYHKPASLDECLQMLADLDERAADGSGRLQGAQVLAGGTDVIFNMRLKLFQPRNVISIRCLPELGHVEQLPDGGLRIGAACRLTDLADSPVIQNSYPAFAQALAAVASVHVRNVATLGGNICLETRCWYTNNSEEWRHGREGCFKTDCELCHVIPSSGHCHAINNADTPPALIVLGAVLSIRSINGSREVPIADFYRPDGINSMDLGPGELLTHVTLPPPAGNSVFLKYAVRRGMDFALGAVAASVVENGAHGRTVKVAVGSVSSAPIILREARRLLERDGLNEASIEAAVASIRGEMGEVTNLYARATYKKQIAKVLVRRALTALQEQSDNG